MDAELERYLDWLRGHSVHFDVARDLARDPDHDGALVPDPDAMRAIELPGLPPFVEHRDPGRGLAADHATLSVARALFAGDRFALGTRLWDIGCGTGVLAVAAGLAGARGIVASDIDSRALELVRRTAADANVAVRICLGSLLDPIPRDLKADVIAANLPHKPAPPGCGLPVGQSGGPDGDDVHGAFALQAANRLERGNRVFFFLHSLPHPRLLRRYQECFDLNLLSWKRRYLGEHEYGALQEGFLERARAGASFVREEGGRRFLIAGVWEAVRR